ncbi:hypothetical protein Y025_1897 [Burkholderia pseudomallei TSV32]|nr:hypothetical protein Y025_1897 [Burkholderia pseudomallei TSV32]
MPGLAPRQVPVNLVYIHLRLIASGCYRLYRKCW